MNPDPVLPPSMALSGHYALRPGVRGSIVGQRPVLGGGRLGRLLRGQHGESVERTLGNVFTLCAHAHRRTARLALNAANPTTKALAAVESSALLRLETARDHLRSMALDWPHRQPEPNNPPHDLDWLRDCPLPLLAAPRLCQAEEAWAALAQLRDWLGLRALGLPVRDWLASHREPEAFAQWCRARAPYLPPARRLAAWYRQAHALKPETRCLDLLDTNLARQSVRLRQVAQAMASEAGFVQQPTWLGQCAETGTWTRLRHLRGRATIQHSAWTRLSARWIEVMDIAAANPLPFPGDSDPLLASGALTLGEGQAIAWCEMARGLLLHWVQLDPQGRVDDYRVLAPTEWNFHPDGALARALTALPPGDTASAHTLAAAFDPCVDCTVQANTSRENANA
ncbi:MAG: nickel-dependent hydrogenase large subunit [Burkholderiales bacterium]|nr:nickel-dependent hydrogenase large subunit [Burkholderiales bacterium]